MTKKPPNRIIVNCPECRAPAYFECASTEPEDIKLLIEVDGRACRYCGAALIPLRELLDTAL